jgi:bilin biosynthesis protein
LLGWLKHESSYALILENLNHPQPQFLKSRSAAAIALGELGNPDAIPTLRECLSVPIFNLQYSALLALEKLGDFAGTQVLADSDNELLRSKARRLNP